MDLASHEKNGSLTIVPQRLRARTVPVVAPLQSLSHQMKDKTFQPSLCSKKDTKRPKTPAVIFLGIFLKGCLWSVSNEQSSLNRTSFSLSLYIYIKQMHVPGCPSLTDSEVKRNVDIVQAGSDKKKMCECCVFAR